MKAPVQDVQDRRRPVTAIGVVVQKLALPNINHDEEPVQVCNVDGDEDAVDGANVQHALVTPCAYTGVVVAARPLLQPRKEEVVVHEGARSAHQCLQVTGRHGSVGVSR